MVDSMAECLVFWKVDCLVYWMVVVWAEWKVELWADQMESKMVVYSVLY